MEYRNEEYVNSDTIIVQHTPHLLVSYYFGLCISVIISFIESVEIAPAIRGDPFTIVTGKEYPKRITFSTSGKRSKLTPL